MATSETQPCANCAMAGNAVWKRFLGWINLGKPVKVFFCPMCDRVA